jgi:hypothetical protein
MTIVLGAREDRQSIENVTRAAYIFVSDCPAAEEAEIHR